MDIPLNVEVHCIDGLAGHSITTITNPASIKVTHLVVTEKQDPQIKRLIPIQLVWRVTKHSIHLNCTLTELSKLKQLEKLVINPANGHITHLVLRENEAYL